MVVEPHTFFVYGTLKRGQANYPLVAAVARDTAPATILGRLYDVGPFPALAEGNELVHGEIFSVDPPAVPGLLELLDDLEGYDPADPAGSIYRRRVVAATTTDGSTVSAYAYFYNRDPATLRQLPSGTWGGPSAAEVPPLSDELIGFGRRVRDFPR